MRILITGAAGFLGSHLSDHLLADGHEVIGMDNFVTGSPDNIAHLAGNEKFSFYKRDVSNYIFVPGKVDAILHFASPASPNPQSKSGYFNLPIQTMKAGALGTHNCLGLARVQNARFLLASTSEIYGDPEVHPQAETYAGNVDPVGTRAVYDEAKRFAESLTMAYHRFHNVNTSIVRIFNTYGPRMDLEDGRALPNLIKQALLGQPLTVYRRWSPNPLILLCGRSGGWHHKTALFRRALSRQYRQPERNDHPAICRNHQQGYRQHSGHHLRGRTQRARPAAPADPISPALKTF